MKASRDLKTSHLIPCDQIHGALNGSDNLGITRTRKMRSFSASVIPFVLMLIALPNLVSGYDDIDKLLGGVWIVTSSEMDGVMDGPDSFRGTKVQFFKDGTMTIHEAIPNEPELKARFKLNSKSKPIEIDIFHDDEKAQGIFKWIMQGNELQLCLRGSHVAEKGRPKKFKTTKGSGLILYKMKRE